MTGEACRTYNVDGVPVTVYGRKPLTEEQQAALSELLAAAKRYLEENPPPIRSVPRLRVGGSRGTRIVYAAKCPEHGWVGPDRGVRAKVWEDCRAHDAAAHPTEPEPDTLGAP